MCQFSAPLAQVLKIVLLGCSKFAMAKHNTYFIHYQVLVQYLKNKNNLETNF